MDGQDGSIDDRPVNAGDERILELLAAGSPQGMEMLYDQYGRLAYTVAQRVLNDEGAAQDVVQEAFLSVWRRSDSYLSERGSLRTWLCSIVHHRSLDRLRGSSGRARQDVTLDVLPPEAAASDTWAQVAASIDREAVRRALAELSSDQRQTLELAYYGGYSQSEISRVMGVPLGTVKGRTRMGLRRMRSLLDGRGLEFSTR